MTAKFDAEGRFLGHDPSEGCEHRTVGSHRAWCLTCGEWCYPNIPCVRCERAILTARGEVDAEDVDTSSLETDLAAVLNKHSVENASGTPDFILAQYLVGCLRALAVTTRLRDDWHGTMRHQDSLAALAAEPPAS